MSRYRRDTKVNELLLTDKSYRVLYTLNGRRRELTIGSLNIPINVARNSARKILGEVAQGIDPLNKKILEAKQITLNDAFDKRCQNMLDRKKKCIKVNVKGEIVGDIITSWKKDVKNTLGKLKLDQIETGDLTNLHEQITKRAPFQANRVIDEIRTTYEYAISKSYTKFNPAKYVIKNPEPRRNRPLTDVEFAEINRQINIKEANIHPRHINSIKYIRLVILTGGRCISELGEAKWSDLQDNKLVLKNHKTDYLGEPRVIYLSKQAMSIINSIDRNGEYILGVKYPIRMWHKIREAAGCPDVTLKDLRHNFGTLAPEVISLEEASPLMGHTSVRMTERYRHLRDKKGAELNQKVSDYMTKIMMSN